ncbi:retrovirus-related pol polyprotein from transposon TNT 1-94, partial [Tanacetum coccineum]
MWNNVSRRMNELYYRKEVDFELRAFKDTAPINLRAKSFSIIDTKNEALDKFKSVGIIHETTPTYTPQQNGISERKNRELKEMVNSMLSYSGLSQGLCVVPEEVTEEEQRDEVSDQNSYWFNVEDDPKTFNEAMKSQDVDLTKEFLSSRFSMKDIGEADVIFGIKNKHESNGKEISQSHYIDKVLKNSIREIRESKERYHFIREIRESKEIEVVKIGTKDNAADAFTKVVLAFRDRASVCCRNRTTSGIKSRGYCGLEVRGLVRSFDRGSLGVQVYGRVLLVRDRAKFDVEKFDGSNDFGLWRVKMRCLLIQHGWEAALDPFPETMTDAEKTAALKTDVYKKAHSALLLCLDNKVLREVNKEDSAAGVWLKESLTLEDVLSSLNSRELKKRTDAKDDGDGLYVRGRSDHRGNQGRGSSRSKSKGKGTYKLKCYICYYEDHLKKDNPKRNKKKSTGLVKKNAGQGSGMHSEGYDNGDLLMAVSEERISMVVRFCSVIIEHVPSWGYGNVRVQMKYSSSFVLENVRYIPELKRNLISLGTLDREGYIVKLQNGRVKAKSGEASVRIQEKESLAQVWHKHLGHISEAGLRELKKERCFGICENCVLGKSTRVSFGRGQHTTEGVIDYVYAVLWGPSQ